MSLSVSLRGRRRPGPLTPSLREWGVWAAFFFSLAAPLLGAEPGGRGTPAGTRIVNSASVVYTVATGMTSRVDAAADFVVGQVAGVDLERGRLSFVVPGNEVVFPHTLQNLGNGADVFDLHSTSPRGWPTRFYHDVDGDQRWTAADSLLSGPVPLTMDETFLILVVVGVPVGFGPGDRETISVLAVSRFDPDVHDALLDEIGFGDPELQPSIDKRVDLLEASEGDLLTYTIIVRVDGPGRRDGYLVLDTIRAGSTYEPGTLRLNGAPLTDRAGDDGGHFDATSGVVSADLEEVPIGQAATLSFKVRIDVPSAVGTQVVNRAWVEVETPFGVLRAVSQNAVTHVATPSLQIRKKVDGPKVASLGDSLFYSIEVWNPSKTLSAFNLEIVDTLPEHLSLRRAEPVATQVGDVLRWRIPALRPGQVAGIRMVVEVGDVGEAVDVVNRASLIRDGMSDGRGESGVVTLTVGEAPSLALDLEAEVLEVQVGSSLPLRVGITNDGGSTLTDLVVRIVLPRATSFVPQTIGGSFGGASPSAAGGTIPVGAALIGAGAARAIQVDSFRVRRDTLLVWIPGELRPAESFEFRYVLAVRNGATGTLLNEGTAQGRRGNTVAAARGLLVTSNRDDAAVVLGRNRPLETRTVIGKVFIDYDADGTQDDAEPGVAGVDVWTEDGEVSSTDEYGKFSFVNLRPGRHAFRADEETLPVDLRVAERARRGDVRTVETTGWTSGRVVFPLVPRRARVAEISVPVDGSAASCAALAQLLELDDHRCVPEGGARGEAVSPPPPDPSAKVRLRADRTGWPEAALLLPAGWELVPGSVNAGGQAVAPRASTDPDGQSWLVWDDLPTADFELSLRPTQGRAETPATQVVVVTPLRSPQARERAQAAAFLTGPTVEIFAPVDGFVSRTNRLYLGARGEPMRPVSLFAGDSLIVETTFRPDGVQDFIGVELQPGPQVFRLRTTNSWGAVVWDSVRVHRSGQPAELQPEAPYLTVVADARTPARTRVRVLDGWGVPVVNRPLVTLRTDHARILGRDQDPSSIGHQVRVDDEGWVDVDLVGERETGSGLVVLTAADAYAELPIHLLPPIRLLIVTALGQIGLGAGGQDFGAVTARGRLDERTSVTLSYDSRRLNQGREIFGNTSDPLEDGRYSMMGDASQQRSVSASRYNFAATLERGMDWLRLGDVQTTEFSKGMELGRYGRSVSGVTAHLTTGDLVWDAFGASTTKALRQVQIRGSGTSGPFALDGEILPGTERIQVETRAVANPTRTLSEQVLTRFVDYQIDYELGSVLLKQPLPSVDALGNPIFLVLTFEAESGGERSAVVGLRGSSDLQRFIGELADSIPLSLSVIRDAQSGQEFTMASVQTGIVQRDGALLLAEIASVSSGDSTDVATRLEGSLPFFAGRVMLGGTWTRVGAEFRNPANVALLPGAEEVRVAADVEFGPSRVTLSHERQRFGQRGIERTRTALGLTRALRSDLELTAGFAADGSTTTGLASSSGAGEYKLTWQASDRLKMFGEARDQLWAEGDLPSTGSFLGGGASYELAPSVTLEARHALVQPTGGEASYEVSSFGFTSQPRTGTKAWSTYQLMGGADGRVNAAVVGLNQQFTVGSAWRLQMSGERRSGVAGAAPGDLILSAPFEREEEDYVAGAVGMEFLPQFKPYRVSFRAEAKNGSRLSSKVASLAGDISFGGSLALLSRQEYIDQSQVAGAEDRRTKSRSSLWGLAFRPTESDQLNVLFKLHYKSDENPSGVGVLSRQSDEQRLIGALETIWAPAAQVEVAARVAVRTMETVLPGTAGISRRLRSETQFLGAHVSFDASAPLGFKIEARGMVTGAEATSVWDVTPSLLFRPVAGFEMETGYRFGDLRDPDFAIKAGSGFFVSFGVQVTEQVLPSVAEFWRGRFGR